MSLAGGLALAAATSAHAQDGELAVDCDASSPRLDSECRFGEQQEFSIAVHVVRPPDDGYAAFQLRLHWDDAVLFYRAQDPSEEAAWTPCTAPARLAQSGPEGPSFLDTSLSFACLPLPVDPSNVQRFDDVGAVVRLRFVCIGQGSSELELVPRIGDSLANTYFFRPPDEALDPSLAAAKVDCRGPAADVSADEAPADAQAQSIGRVDRHGPRPAEWAVAVGLVAVVGAGGSYLLFRRWRS